MPLTQFSPPANVNDLPKALLQGWSDVVNSWFQQAIAQIQQEAKPPAGKIYLFNELDHPEAAAGTGAEINWNGYPKKYTLAIPNTNDRLFKTEQLYLYDLTGQPAGYATKTRSSYQIYGNAKFRDQDEYCEWHSVLDPKTQALTKIIFSCENPEYWTYISRNYLFSYIRSLPEVTSSKRIYIFRTIFIRHSKTDHF